MGKTTGRKKRIVITTAAMLAIGGGAAFAYWTVSSTSDATATSVDVARGYTFSTTSFTGGALSPDGPTQTATFTVTNPGTGVQMLNDVVASVADVGGASWKPLGGCTADDFTVGHFMVDGKRYEPSELAPGAFVTGTVSLKMVNRIGVNQDGCQGRPVPLHFAAS